MYDLELNSANYLERAKKKGLVTSMGPHRGYLRSANLRSAGGEACYTPIGLGPSNPHLIPSCRCDTPMRPREAEPLREAAHRYLEAVEAESPFVIRRGIKLAELALAFQVANADAESDAGSA